MTARKLAAGYGVWVRSIRSGVGAIPFPTPAHAKALPWTDDERAVVADRVQTQLVGSPTTVVDHLDRLREATDVDELIITTITHDHADPVRSYQLLAEERAKRHGATNSSDSQEMVRCPAAATEPGDTGRRNRPC